MLKKAVRGANAKMVGRRCKKQNNVWRLVNNDFWPLMKRFANDFNYGRISSSGNTDRYKRKTICYSTFP